jgi:hypothetical protein
MLGGDGRQQAAGPMAALYALLSSRSSSERTSVRAFVRTTSAASSRESPATSVNHTNASIPRVAPIPKTNRSSSGSGMLPLRGERASSIHPIRRRNRFLRYKQYRLVALGQLSRSHRTRRSALPARCSPDQMTRTGCFGATVHLNCVVGYP